MRRGRLGLGGVLLIVACALVGCSAVSDPLGFLGWTTETVGPLVVSHPTAWHVEPGPPRLSDRAVPTFYLSNQALTVVPCPSMGEIGTYTGCPQPLDQLDPGGVLVTVSPNLGLNEPVPPKLNVTPAVEGCAAIGGDQSIEAVAAGSVVEACLRGPGLDRSDVQVRQLVLRLRHAHS